MKIMIEGREYINLSKAVFLARYYKFIEFDIL